MKYFMIDLETMGTDMESDDIIQIALLECIPHVNGYVPGKSYCRTLHTSQKPKNDWIKNTHKELLQVSMKCPIIEVAKVRAEILAFFRECGVNEPAMIMGLNATTFDVPYMVYKGFLRKPYQDANNKLVGDYHYRIYELKGAFNLAQDVLRVDSKVLFNRAAELCPEIIPFGRPHEALHDCYGQLKTLNGVIRLLRTEAPRAHTQLRLL
jgi:oligoribonuclease (3'-5' exoribonuclease)